MKIALAFAAVLALGLPARPGHADAASDAAAEKGVGILEGLANIIAANKDNCDAMGDKIGVFADQNADQIKKLREMGKTVTPAQKKAYAEKYKLRTDAATSKMKPGLAGCSKSARVAAALNKASLK